MHFFQHQVSFKKIYLPEIQFYPKYKFLLNPFHTASSHYTVLYCKAENNISWKSNELSREKKNLYKNTAGCLFYFKGSSLFLPFSNSIPLYKAVTQYCCIFHNIKFFFSSIPLVIHKMLCVLSSVHWKLCKHYQTHITSISLEFFSLTFEQLLLLQYFELWCSILKR